MKCVCFCVGWGGVGCIVTEQILLYWLVYTVAIICEKSSIDPVFMFFFFFDPMLFVYLDKSMKDNFCQTLDFKL